MINNNSKAITGLVFVLLFLVTLSLVSATDNNDNSTNISTIQDNVNLTSNIQTSHNIELNKTSNINNDVKLGDDDENESDSDETDKKIIYLSSLDYSARDYEAGSTLIINGSLSDVCLDIKHENITITGINDAKLINSMIHVYESGSITLSDVNFETDDRTSYPSALISLETDNNIIENATFLVSRSAIISDSACMIDITTNNNTIRNCMMETTLPAMQKDWELYGEASVVTAIRIYGDYNSVLDTNIVINEGMVEVPYGTLTGIFVYGNNDTINNTVIDMKGTLFLYGVIAFNHNNTITNNNIRVISERYANGISLNGETVNCTVENNTIDVSSLDDEMGNSAYGIIITETNYAGGKYNTARTKTSNITIKGNTIKGSSAQMYGIEQFGGANVTISDNNIDISGIATMGVGSIGANTTIVGNAIKVSGTGEGPYESLDYLKPETYGVYLYNSGNSTVFGNSIDSAYGGIHIDKSYGSTIFGNDIVSSNNINAIYETGELLGSTISNNQINKAITDNQEINNNQTSNDNDNTNQTSDDNDDINQTFDDTNQTSGDTNQTSNGTDNTNQTNTNPSDDNEDTNKTLIDDIIEDIVDEVTNNTADNNQTLVDDIIDDIKDDIIENNTSNETVANDTKIEDIPIEDINQTIVENITQPEIENITQPIVENITQPIIEDNPEIIEDVPVENTTKNNQETIITQPEDIETKEDVVEINSTHQNTTEQKTEINSTQEINKTITNPVETNNTNVIETNTTQQNDGLIGVGETQSVSAFDVSVDESEDDSESEDSSSSSAGQVSATATISEGTAKAYEVTKSINEEINTEDAYMVWMVFVLACLALIYGFKRGARL